MIHCKDKKRLQYNEEYDLNYCKEKKTSEKYTSLLGMKVLSIL